MRAADVFDVLDRLDEAGVRHWVGGGWGVAALVGRLTRVHRDLDLAIQADDFDRCLDVLAALGYLPETDWLPVRIEMGAPDDRWVDLHPVKFGQDGYGRQEGLGGAYFDYAPGAFTSGSIDGRPVPCLSAAQQRQFRTGYELRPQDLHDLAELAALEER
jgi:lincosamide nucleotidyltransferase A/C/D/E